MDADRIARRLASGRGTRFVLMLAGAWAIGTGNGRVEAASRKSTLSPQQARAFAAWNNYLAKGETTWASNRPPDFSPAVRSTIWQIVKSGTQGEQLANPMIEYLLWRRSLNVKRFATYHPNLSPQLAKLLRSPTLPSGAPGPLPIDTPVPQAVTPPPQTLTPPYSSDPLQNPVGQDITPASVPEPNSALLALGMAGVGLWWRHRMIERQQRQG
ncbi:PEP-CTERM sorting domain-containing protein [Aquisphaera insulae]|uniref:PEP-CTERM sorting domain-containing protein n=1 Tax=Aquisphaera insulae TaxID=2712864 RepID=UPI0013EACC00|nr:PEP-CTERM sorting domain-containing protein [Aquisphaera insulae]